MTNYVYPLALKAFLEGDFALDTATVKACLLTTTPTYSSAHDFLDDVSTYRVGTDATLGSKTTTGGVFDAADTTWTAVSGSAVYKLVIYQYGTGDADSRLLVWMDDFTSGFPFTPNGGDFTVTWHTSGIFSI